MTLVGGYQDTRTNHEDFAITPFLFLVWLNNERFKIYGLGICWGFHSTYLGIATKLPKGYPKFINLNKKN